MFISININVWLCVYSFCRIFFRRTQVPLLISVGAVVVFLPIEMNIQTNEPSEGKKVYTQQPLLLSGNYFSFISLFHFFMTFFCVVCTYVHCPSIRIQQNTFRWCSL